MKVDGGVGFDLSRAAAAAKEAEDAGYDGVWSAEACAAFDVDPATLPRIVGCAETIGVSTAFGDPIAVAGPRPAGVAA